MGSGRKSSLQQAYCGSQHKYKRSYLQQIPSFALAVTIVQHHAGALIPLSFSSDKSHIPS